MYYIEYDYETGNTFGSHEESRVLTTAELGYGEGFKFEKLEDAKEVLKRMREHYDWKDSISTTYGDDLERPKWLSRSLTNSSDSFNCEVDGEEVIFYGHYIGYFERLIGASIVSEKDELSFKV